MDLNAFILHKITVSVKTHIYFVHVVQMHAKYYLDSVQTILWRMPISKNIYFNSIL